MLPSRLIFHGAKVRHPIIQVRSDCTIDQDLPHINHSTVTTGSLHCHGGVLCIAQPLLLLLFKHGQSPEQSSLHDQAPLHSDLTPWTALVALGALCPLTVRPQVCAILDRYLENNKAKQPMGASLVCHYWKSEQAEDMVSNILKGSLGNLAEWLEPRL